MINCRLRVFLCLVRSRGFEISPVSLDNMASLDDKQQKSFLRLVVCLAFRVLRRLLFERVVHFADNQTHFTLNSMNCVDKCTVFWVRT